MEEKIHAPTVGELPTVRQLNRATLIAAGVAATLLVTIVMPAEYGMDPLRTGNLLGLTAMGESKHADEQSPVSTSAEDELVLDDPAESSAQSALGGDASEVQLTLQPGEGREVKATMTAGQEISFEWSAANNAQINWELHGEELGAPGNEYTSYERSVSAGESGKFRAPFDGTHGWYWRNDTGAPATIKVRASGDFSKFELVPEK
jgi:hypothetical protein